jgi:hypothetical protein
VEPTGHPPAPALDERGGAVRRQGRSNHDNIWAHHRKLAAGLARAMSQASVYTLANPTAAACQYLKSYPTAAPAGESLADQLAAIETSVVLRSKVFVNGSDPLGTVSKDNLDAALVFAGGDPAKIERRSLVD